MPDRNGRVTLLAEDWVAFSSPFSHGRFPVCETAKFPQRKWKRDEGERGREREGERGGERGREKELLLKKVPMSFGTSPFGGSRLGGGTLSSREGLKIRRLLRKIQRKLGFNFTRNNVSLETFLSPTLANLIQKKAEGRRKYECSEAFAFSSSEERKCVFCEYFSSCLPFIPFPPGTHPSFPLGDEKPRTNNLAMATPH